MFPLLFIFTSLQFLLHHPYDPLVLSDRVLPVIVSGELRELHLVGLLSPEYLPPLVALIDAGADRQEEEDEGEGQADEGREGLSEGLLHVVHVAVQGAVEKEETQGPQEHEVRDQVREEKGHH